MWEKNYTFKTIEHKHFTLVPYQGTRVDKEQPKPFPLVLELLDLLLRLPSAMVVHYLEFQMKQGKGCMQETVDVQGDGGDGRC